MDDIYGIRRKNLEAVLALPALSGLQYEVDKADLVGVSKSMWSQTKNPEYRIGEDMARKIELALGLEPNWMDNQNGDVSHTLRINPDSLRSVLQITQATIEAMGMPFVASEHAEIILDACRAWGDSPGSDGAKAGRVAVAIMKGLRGQ